MGETVSYCCPVGSTSRSCQRDFCSPKALTTSMKFYTCPYEPRACGSSTSKLVAEMGKLYTLQANTNLYVQNSICYWTIRSLNTANGQAIPSNTFLEIKAVKLQGVSIYVSTGTSPTLAKNETTMGTFSSNVLTYRADQTLFVVGIAIDANPLLSFSYRFYQVVPTITVPNCTEFQNIEVVNNSYVCVNMTIPPPIII